MNRYPSTEEVAAQVMNQPEMNQPEAEPPPARLPEGRIRQIAIEAGGWSEEALGPLVAFARLIEAEVICQFQK